MATLAPQPLSGLAHSSGAVPVPPTSVLLTEVPLEVKELARLVVRGFYPVEEALIVDMLVHYSCVREEDLVELLHFDRMMLKERISTLEKDKFLQVKQRIETDKDGKVVKMNCYYINFKVFLNVVKYKLNLMRNKILTPERDSASFNCTSSICSKTFTYLEVDQLIDPMTEDLKCTSCSSPVEEDMLAGPKQDSCQVLARFNDQMDPLFDLLKKVEGLHLAPGILDPEPKMFPGNIGVMGTRGSGRGPRSPGEKGHCVHNRGGGCHTGENQVKITLADEEEEDAGMLKQKEVPIWSSQSTIGRAAREEAASSSGAGGASVALASVPESDDHYGRDGTMKEDDEITSLLLTHEWKLKDSDKCDTDKRDPESKATSSAKGMEFINYAAVASTWTSPMPATTSSISSHLTQQDESTTGSTVMLSSDDDGGDIPSVKVGDEEFAVTDINEELIVRMTAGEKDRYTQIFQDFYSRMYD